MGQEVSREIFPEEEHLSISSLKTESMGLHKQPMQSCRTDVSSRSVSLEDVPGESSFSDVYVTDSLLGFGSSANVYAVHDRKTWDKFACKEVKMSASVTDSMTICTEIEALKRVNHANVIKLHEVFQTEHKAWLVLELVRGGDLISALSRLPAYNERTIAMLFRQILLGVKHLHEQGIVHRDLKIENMLCEIEGDFEAKQPVPAENMTVKITDFGLSAVCMDWEAGRNKPSKGARHLKEMWGTTEYFAPEVYDRAYGFQADVWSLGCVLYELLTGHLAFPSRDMQVPIADRLFLHGLKKPLRAFEQRSEWKELSNEARSLIKGMLNRDPKRRLSVEECLAHPWIAGSLDPDFFIPREDVTKYHKERSRVKKAFKLWARRNEERTARRQGELYIG